MAIVDFGRHSDDYGLHRPGLPESFYRRLDALAPLAGARALDLGTGPGKVALELAARGASVVGVDVSPNQLETARRLAAELGLDDRTEFRLAPAESTGLPAGAFDLVTAGQCWHWFDRPKATAEIRRVLAPGGRLAIVGYSYLAGRSDVAAATEELVLEFNPEWTMAGWSGIHAEQIDEVEDGGLELVEQFCFHHGESFSHERWRGRVRTCNGVGSGGLPPEEVEHFDRALAKLLAERFPEPMTIPHRVWCVVARIPA